MKNLDSIETVNVNGGSSVLNGSVLISGITGLMAGSFAGSINHPVNILTSVEQSVCTLVGGAIGLGTGLMVSGGIMVIDELPLPPVAIIVIASSAAGLASYFTTHHTTYLE
jgi:hypothetical protein